MDAPRTNLLVYGATGFTGRLVLQHLHARGMDFIVGGRNPERSSELARQYRASARCFELSDPATLDRELRGVRVLLNCAGPFVHTAKPLLDACLRNRVHYLDVSGELESFTAVAERDAQAKARGVMLLPGVGFDVVPSDCLALHLARRLPGAERLILSIAGTNLMSRGSARTFAEYVGKPMYVRRGGRLEPLWLRMPLRWANFGEGARPTVASSWGDLVTAYHSTGIPDIEVYFEANTARWLAIASNQYWGWMFQAPRVKNWLHQQVEHLREGPDAAQRASESATIIGEVSRAGRRLRARMFTPEAYTFTAIASAAVLESVLGGAIELGFSTPARLLGPDFVLALQGVRREDLA